MKQDTEVKDHGGWCICPCHIGGSTLLNCPKCYPKSSPSEGTQEAGWEDEFEQQFYPYIIYGKGWEVKDFIHSLLLSEQKRWEKKMRKLIEEAKPKEIKPELLVTELGKEGVKWYNQALSDYHDALKEKMV